jgi:urea transport system ATP-binding protein
MQQLRRALLTIREDLGIALLLVEQNLDFAFAVTGRGYVLEKGAFATAGPTSEPPHSDQVSYQQATNEQDLIGLCEGLVDI